MTLDEHLNEMTHRVAAIWEVGSTKVPDADDTPGVVGLIVHGHDGQTIVLEAGVTALGVAQVTVRAFDVGTLPVTVFEAPDGSVLITS